MFSLLTSLSPYPTPHPQGLWWHVCYTFYLFVSFYYSPTVPRDSVCLFAYYFILFSLCCSTDQFLLFQLPFHWFFTLSPLFLYEIPQILLISIFEYFSFNISIGSFLYISCLCWHSIFLICLSTFVITHLNIFTTALKLSLTSVTSFFKILLIVFFYSLWAISVSSCD